LLLCGITPGLFAQIPTSTAHFFRQQSFDVISYDVEMRINELSSKYVEGTNEIILKKDETDIPKNFYFHAIGIKPDSVYYNGIKTDFYFNTDEEKADYYFINIDSGSAEFDTVLIYYSGTMLAEQPTEYWGGVHFDGGILYNLGVGFNNPEVSAARYWFPCYDHPSDKVKFRVTFEVPTGYTAVSNGLLENSYIGDTYDKYIWNMESDAATYLLNFAIGKLFKLDFTLDGSVPIEVYCTEDYKEKCEFAFSRIGEMLQCHEEYFGKYPFEKIGYVITEKGSMEHQTLINIAAQVIDAAYAGNNDRDETIFHELTHQRFGDAISPKDFRDPWLNEAFATWSESLWAGWSGEPEEYHGMLNSDRDNYVKRYSVFDKNAPLYDFDYSEVGNYPPTIYYKGSIVLDMLKYEVGDSVFFDFLKKYASEFEGKNLNTGEFVEFFNETVGSNYDWFFEQWLYRKGFPEFDFEKVYHKDYETGLDMMTELKISQVIPAGEQPYLRVPFEFSGKTPENERHIINLTLSSGDTTVNLLEENFKKSGLFLNTCNNVAPCIKIGDMVTTGVAKEKEYEATGISPNPAGERITINTTRKSVISYVCVYSAKGKLMKELPDYSGGTIDVSDLPAGVYYVKISTEDSVEFTSFVKE
jgi:aminopeptidase N